MYQPFRNLTRTYAVLHQGLAGAERVFEILDEPPNIKDKPDAKIAPRFAKAIEFYDVSSGQITIDGVDIRDVSLATLRSQIGIVTQHTFLFDDTVRNNIAYGDPERGIDDIIAAAKAAHADKFIRSMPNGYDSQIGEMGMQLSGG